MTAYAAAHAGDDTVGDLEALRTCKVLLHDGGLDGIGKLNT
jgi:hypothetical protein